MSVLLRLDPELDRPLARADQVRDQGVLGRELVDPDQELAFVRDVLMPANPVPASRPEAPSSIPGVSGRGRSIDIPVSTGNTGRGLIA